LAQDSPSPESQEVKVASILVEEVDDKAAIFFDEEVDGG